MSPQKRKLFLRVNVNLTKTVIHKTVQVDTSKFETVWFFSTMWLTFNSLSFAQTKMFLAQKSPFCLVCQLFLWIVWGFQKGNFFALPKKVFFLSLCRFWNESQTVWAPGLKGVVRFVCVVSLWRAIVPLLLGWRRPSNALADHIRISWKGKKYTHNWLWWDFWPSARQNCLVKKIKAYMRCVEQWTHSRSRWIQTGFSKVRTSSKNILLYFRARKKEVGVLLELWWYIPSSGSRGALGAWPPLPPRFLQNDAVFRQFLRKTPILSTCWAQASLGSKLHWAPPDQHPGSAPVTTTLSVSHLATGPQQEERLNPLLQQLPSGSRRQPRASSGSPETCISVEMLKNKRNNVQTYACFDCA